MKIKFLTNTTERKYCSLQEYEEKKEEEDDDYNYEEDFEVSGFIYFLIYCMGTLTRHL